MTPVGRDVALLFAARALRLVAYGALSVVLVFYLTGLGLTEPQVGLLLTLTLLGDTAVSLAVTTHADRLGRRRMLTVSAGLMAGAGLVFISTDAFWLLVLAATVGVISPSGQEVGPFLPVEQAALARAVPADARTRVFAWYTLAGALATSVGALGGGLVPAALQRAGTAPLDSYRWVIAGYAAIGLVLAALFQGLSREADAGPTAAAATGPGAGSGLWGLHESRGTVTRLAALFALDAFGGGFVAQSFAAYWFHLRFGVDPATLGPIFFWANLLAGLSALLAARLAARFGLVRTMVWTHLPSNVLLILVPLMPTLPLAVAVLWARFSISQMDVPTRQSYVMAVVRPDERSAAGGVTGVARTLGAAVSPVIVGQLFARPALISLPFVIAGTLKIAYDLLLYRAFVGVQPAEERAGTHRPR
ncbi:MAG: MFS transporter [Vicinamibacterales bacterium]